MKDAIIGPVQPVGIVFLASAAIVLLVPSAYVATKSPGEVGRRRIVGPPRTTAKANPGASFDFPARRKPPMKTRATATSRRRFIQTLTAGSLAGTAVLDGVARGAQTAAPPGVIVHGDEGLRIPPTADGRVITIRIDSERTPGLRMSMIDEDLPPKSEIRVHLHQHADEIIFIRIGTGVATLGDREVPVAAGATIYVPRGEWHGLRNDSQDMLGMTAIYSPAGFEQIFKDRLLHPNRTPAEAEAVRKKHGIVYRGRP